MAYAARSPLVGALESLVEEQVGRETSCPNGAGVLRVRGTDACFDARSGVATTGAGGEHWCVSCHAPGENLRSAMPPWSATGDRAPRAHARSGCAVARGVSCAACHSAGGASVAAHAARGAGLRFSRTLRAVGRTRAHDLAQGGCSGERLSQFFTNWQFLWGYRRSPLRHQRCGARRNAAHLRRRAAPGWDHHEPTDRAVCQMRAPARICAAHWFCR